MAQGKSVRELLNSVDSLELSEWMAYYRIEPFGEERADYRNAIACKVTADVHCKNKTKVKDFMPKFGKSGYMTEEMMLAKFGI